MLVGLGASAAALQRQRKLVVRLRVLGRQTNSLAELLNRTRLVLGLQPFEPYG
jgi:hypothetical protein